MFAPATVLPDLCFCINNTWFVNLASELFVPPISNWVARYRLFKEVLRPLSLCLRNKYCVSHCQWSLRLWFVTFKLISLVNATRAITQCDKGLPAPPRHPVAAPSTRMSKCSQHCRLWTEPHEKTCRPDVVMRTKFHYNPSNTVKVLRSPYVTCQPANQTTTHTTHPSTPHTPSNQPTDH